MPKSVAVLLAIAFCVVTFEVHVNNCQTLLYGSRLASFPKPDFRFNFTLFSQRGSHSYKEIRHGLNVDPFYVRVYARGKSVKGNSFCFNGVGASQASPKVSGYGGLVYAYNSMYVRIWAPTQYKSYSNGRIIYLKDGWGSGWDVYQMSEAEVVVEVWRLGPAPLLQFDIALDTLRKSFREVDHKLGQTPERISVSITPDGLHYPRSNPNKGFWFDAIGSSQNPNPTTGYGGVIFAYNARRIRLWTADGNVTATGCVFVGHGWGNEKNTQYSKKCIVRIKLWTNLLPAPVFQSEWHTLKAQRNANSVKDISHNLGILPSLVIVQLRIKLGINIGYIFEGQGAVMSGDNNVNGYGGTTFAYDENLVRIWAPNRKDGSSKGFAVLVKDGWGNGDNLQRSLSVDYRIIIHSSPCDSNFETTFERDTCINTKYLSYQWTNYTRWSRCSSICNNGTKIRETKGCKVTARKTILACNFKRDFCGWTSSRSSAVKMQWVRTNQATPEPNTGPKWGHPKGNYYVYTNSTNFQKSQKGILTSPKVNNGKKCLLRFFWNMYGRDVGDLYVHVKRDGQWGYYPVWGMKNSQGELVWRQAVINLDSYIVQKVRFIHQLPGKDEDVYGSKPCPKKVCPLANVAISNIKLECERDVQVLDAEVCRERLVTSASCEHYTSDYTTKGPAYSEEIVLVNGKRLKFVKAVGKTKDIIASYRFRVIFESHYNLWAQAFSTRKTTNSFFFRVNDGDWHHWHTVILKSFPLWQYYRYKSFLLSPGIHSVTLRQSEMGFRLDRLILAPVRVTQWTDLGMQSRYIPDSKLRGHPDNNSKPPPKYGRLNGVDAWCSTDHNPGNVYFQITLPDLAIVSRIAVQGGQNINRKSNNYWVISFNMKVALDGFFTWYRNRTGGIEEFQANKDAGGIVNHTLESPVPVRGVKIYPQLWQNWICMRTELYGMYILPEVCATASKPEISKTCVGDRDCGKNAECGKVSVNRIPMSVFNATKPEVGLERCHCHTWYHGPSCQHYGCKPNPCQNKGKCFENNSKFTCHCPAGYHGITCQHPCPTGRYGNNCSGVCLCTQHGTCDMISGKCSCFKGYHGKHCEKECPSGYYGYRCSQKCQCRSGSFCDKVNGTCNCTSGWTGRFCESPCHKTLWGYGCLNKCNCPKSALSCDRFNGTCLCPPGKIGRQCKQECLDGKYGLNCENMCLCDSRAACSKIDGSCNCLVPGVTGVLCDTPCSGGTFGQNCGQKCRCHTGSSCDRFNGTCSCSSGKMGKFCDKTCPQGYWGHNCSLRCQCVNGARCAPESGLCSCVSTLGCKCSAGWMGNDCRLHCPEGRWGQNCDKMCYCANQGLCEKMNGTCLCKPGFTGAKCERPCRPGYYGLQCNYSCPCILSRSFGCDNATGLCHCRAGWQGRLCDIPCRKGSWGVNCQNTCECINGSCNSTTGRCTCFAGVKPSRFCDKPCKPGFFGIGCKYNCSCEQGPCDPVTGACTCRGGWYGVNCDSRCNGTYNPPLCDKKCKCNGMSSCTGHNGFCQCLPGWTGLKCDSKCPSGYYGYKCQAKCPVCLNSNNHCDPQTGMCQCNPGYTGDNCADACPVGYYGDQCRLICNCSNEGVCNNVDGSCSCSPGWRGVRCDEECPDGSYGPDCTLTCSCTNGICNKTDGSCSCAVGYHGNTCSTPCPIGIFGLGCQKKCDCHNNSTCNGITGACHCLPGWGGARCSVRCSPGFYGASCKSRCNCPVATNCDPVSGSCLCPPGKQGPMCLEYCDEGFFGSNCSQPCQCKSPHTCHPVSGSCACNRGWTGANCTEPCPAGTYGMKCASKCVCDPDFTVLSQPCDHVTGQCNCKSRYYGVSCRDECKNGFYGQNCSKQCKCQNGGQCDVLDGTCTCLPGYIGDHCEHRCAKGFYGVNCSVQCRCMKEHMEKCDPGDGSCVCQHGYIGVLCEDICPEGQYGNGCKMKCTCKNEAHCDHVTGSCKCTLGYTGKDCDKACTDGWYGENCASKCLCENFAKCNSFNGSCICAPGYQGERCERPCLEGRYGLNCVRLCDCNPKNTDSCDTVTGNCVCRPGTIGKRCDEPCKDGFYGRGCKMSCPECSVHVTDTCHKEHGQCACSNGYQGYLCLDSCPVGYYGTFCKNVCVCKKGAICHHVNGECMVIRFATLTSIVNQELKLFQDKDQTRNFRIGFEKLIYKYFDVFVAKRGKRLSAISAPNYASQTLLRAHINNTPAVTPTESMTSSTTRRQFSKKHDFSVRIISLESVRITASDLGTRVIWVLVDNYTLLNASFVQRIINRIDSKEISEAIAVEYLVGPLYTERKEKFPLWLIGLISGSGFMLVMGFLALFKLMWKKRRARRGSPQYRRAGKDQPEFEMQPCIGRNATYPLAFDNPYYDVVAVMGLDDDIEEDYYNPLYDDVSVYSDSNYNSSTDESIHKENLINSMVLT